jgi:CDP-diacylglycerol--glycerol-3-phosphate 3-phosphatidyltransferase
VTSEEFAAEWSRLHAGIEPTGLVRAWLRIVRVLAHPLARARVSPTALTLTGLVVAAATLLPASRGWAVLVAVLVVFSAVLDGLDGAVAALSGRASAWGHVLDSLVDRLSDVAFLLALWLLGASPWACVGGGVVLGLLEYTRARASSVVELPVVTIGERPTRVIVVVTFCLSGAALGAVWFTAGAVVVAAVSLVGLVQLLTALRFALRRP